MVDYVSRPDRDETPRETSGQQIASAQVGGETEVALAIPSAPGPSAPAALAPTAGAHAQPGGGAKRKHGHHERGDDQPVQLAMDDRAAEADPAPAGQAPASGDSDKPDEDGSGHHGGGEGVILALGGLAGAGLLVAAVGNSGGGGGERNRPPSASPDNASATEGGAVVTGSVATNDSDPDGDSLSYALVSAVAGLTLNSDGSFSFDPTNAAYDSLRAGETRSVVANYTVSDGRGGTASSTLTILVTGTNDLPVAQADSYSTNEDTLLVVASPGVLANDTDAEGDALTAVLVSGPAHGSLTLNPNGSFSYTPNANYNGPDSFTYKVNDGSADGNTVTVNLTVNPVNDAPVGAADSYSTNEDVVLVVPGPGVLANDSDVDGNALTAVLVSGPAHGSLTLNADGSFSYVPDANYNGPDSFTYKPNDGSSDGAPVTVSLTVSPVNDPPSSVADSYSTNEDTTLVIAAPGVLANDSDVEGDPLTAVLVSGPAHGSLTLNADGSFSYTPDANYNGSDSFTYKANDGTADGNSVTVNLTVNPVNDAPLAAADSYSTNEDTPLVIAAPGVLANDSDIDGDPLSSVLVSGVAHGSLTLNPDGSFTYTPDANYNGPDSFTYKVNDGTADGNTVTVSLTVNPVNDAPVAAADSYSTDEDVALVVPGPGVLANDSDAEGDPLTAVLVSGPAHGSLALNADGSFSYTPDANYNGPDSFTYKANDGTADGNTVTVSLTVNPVNDAPVAAADSYSTNEDTPLVVTVPGVLANDSDVDGDPLSAVLVSGVAHGSLTLNPDGSFSYTPNANYNGPDSFTYKVNDGTADGNTVTVSLTVDPVNDAPVALADSYSTNEDTALVITAPGVLANDSDADGDPLTAVLVSGPAHGSLTLNADGSFSYTPDANYNGPDSFTYKPNDGSSDGAPVTVSLTVNPVNDAPLAVADSYSTNEDTPLVVTVPGVLANDGDVDGDAISAILVSDVSHGTLTLNPDGSFSYTPNANYNGPDSFTYKVNDGSADGNTVTVNLTVNPVNDAPVGAADSYSTNEDVVLVVPGPGVLANDSDVDGNALTAVLVSGPAHGSLTLNADGSFSYIPDANYNGPDSFTYKPNDGSSDGAPVTVSLTVSPVNDPPSSVADSYSTNEDTTLVIAAPGVLANDSDVEGDPLTSVLVSGPAHGSLTLNADGSFSYTPDANYNGPDSFTYKPNDGTADGNTVTVSLTVNPVNDAPVAVGDSYSTIEDIPLVVPGPGVLTNDSDVDGDPLTAALVTDVSHGTLTLNADGSFSYTPDPGYIGPDSFTYKANDGTADGNTVTVSLSVNSPNTPPVAAADSYSTNEDTALAVTAPGVLANDSDADADSLTAVLVTGPAHASSFTLNPDGSFSYTPDANYNGPDSFTYKANDGTADGNTVTVSLTVNPVNDAPVAAADSYSTNEDTPLVVTVPGVLANDSDVDGDSLTAVLVSGPAHASSFTLNADGSFSYTPAANYNGADSFTYKVNDGTADGNTVTVSLTVNPVNDAPSSVADSYSTNEDTSLTIVAPGVLANDSDPDGDSLNAALVSGVSHGALTLNADGSFSYTPDANYNGPDSFTYKANDGTADGNVVTVNLTVNPVNDAPVANDDVGTANEDSPLLVNAASGVLSNDTDVDGDSLSVSAVQGGTVGSQFALPSGALLTLNADGSYSYDPNGKFEALRPGQTGTDSFTYTASDGHGGTDTATVTVSILGANEVPVAAADTYNGVTGNTPFTVSAVQGVLANDSDPDQPSTGLSVTQVNGTSIGSPVAVTGGSVSMNADGSFTFTPTTGFQGAASFTYTVSDADGGTDTETVTINVNGLVWYVDKDYAGANGASDGSFLRPFTDMTALNGAGGAGDVDGAGDTIFIYDRAGSDVTANIVLENNQKLFGDGHAFVVNGITIGATSANSTIDHAGAGVTLASGNVIDGIDLNGTSTAAVGIQDGNGTVGTVTITNTGIAGQGQIIDIDQGGTLAVTLNAASSTGSSVNNGGVIDLTGVGGSFTISGATTINGTQAQTGIDLTGNSGLAVTFNGVTTVNTGAQQAVNLGANTTSTTSFAAGLDIDTTSGTGFSGASGNTLSISGGTNTINTGTGQILNLNGLSLGASGVTFATLAASGTVATTAISLNNVDNASFSGGNVSIAGTSGATSDGIFIGGGSSSSFSFASATINNTGDEGIEINGAGNGTVTFTTVSIGNATAGNGVEINGSSNSVSINGGTISSGATGDAVNVIGGSGAVTIAAAITKTTAGNVIEVNNHDSGIILFSGNVTASGGVNNGILVTGSNGGSISFTGQSLNLSTGANTAVDLNNNSGGTIIFNSAAGGNGLDIATTSGTGFSATAGGTVTVQGSGNTINASSGTALNISNTTIGASDVTFQSISSGSAADSSATGIILDTTGALGGLHVTGTGTLGSGGTIQHKTGADGSTSTGIGIYLNSTADVQLAGMQLNDFQNFGIRGINVSGFTLSTSAVNGTNGTDAVGDGEGSVYFTNLTGTSSFSTVSVSGGNVDNILVKNSSGSATLTFNNINVGANSLANGNDGLIIEQSGTASMTATVQNSVFTSSRGDLVQAVNNGTNNFSFTFTGNTLSNNHGAIATGGGGVSLAGGTVSTDTFNIQNNTFRDAVGAAVLVVKPTGTSTLNLTFSGNTIGVAGVANSGSLEGSGLKVQTVGGGTLNATITNNNIFQYNNNGIELLAGGGATAQGGNFIARVTGNLVSNPGNNAATAAIPKNGFQLNLGTVPGDTYQAYLTLGGAGAFANDFDSSGKDATPATLGDLDVRLRQRQSTTVHLYALDGAGNPVGYAGANNDNTAVQNFVIANNPSNTAGQVVTVLAQNTVPTGGGFVGTPIPFPLLVSSLPSTPSADPVLTQAQLDLLVAAAIQRWVEAGATAEQVAIMQATGITIADLGGREIGQSGVGHILIDDNAAGWGWFVDATPADDNEFTGSGTSLTALAGTAAAGQVDLLTVIMHELGHQVGLIDDYRPSDADELMAGILDPGDRHLPMPADIVSAQDPVQDGRHVQGWIESSVTGQNDTPRIFGQTDTPGIAGQTDTPGIAGQTDTPGIAGQTDTPGIAGQTDTPGIAGHAEVPVWVRDLAAEFAPKETSGQTLDHLFAAFGPVQPATVLETAGSGGFVNVGVVFEGAAIDTRMIEIRDERVL